VSGSPPISPYWSGTLDVFTSGILSSNPIVAAIQAGIIGGPIDPYPIGVIDTPPVTAAGAKREPAGQLEPAALLIGNDPDFLGEVLYDIQRYLAEQVYYLYGPSGKVVSAWDPYVKN
jgi:hypothetical protein